MQMASLLRAQESIVADKKIYGASIPEKLLMVNLRDASPLRPDVERDSPECEEAASAHRDDEPKGAAREQAVQLSHQLIFAASDTGDSGQADPDFGERRSRNRLQPVGQASEPAKQRGPAYARGRGSEAARWSTQSQASNLAAASRGSGLGFRGARSRSSEATPPRSLRRPGTAEAATESTSGPCGVRGTTLHYRSSSRATYLADTSTGVPGSTRGDQGPGERQHAGRSQVAAGVRQGPGGGGEPGQGGAREGSRLQASSSAQGLHRLLRAARPDQHVSGLPGSTGHSVLHSGLSALANNCCASNAPRARALGCSPGRRAREEPEKRVSRREKGSRALPAQCALLSRFVRSSAFTTNSCAYYGD